ncbi:MAG TPA: UvrB/UvrC motif-containing protein, partial [Candidatus Binataceae bacterium]|nr:UvrB/UvrC motif-containing protein [Candidatus Binataceae bacterium]
EMMDAAEKLDYERAADLRDQIKKLERKAFGMDGSRPAPAKAPAGSAGTHASDPGRDRVQVKKPDAPIRMRPRKGAGAAMAAAEAGKRPVRQGKLKLIPDPPK